MSSTAIGSTPAKGSSSKIKFGLVAKHLAISVRRLSPPESRSPRFLRTCSKENSSMSSSHFLCCSRFESLVSCKTPRILSSTESLRKTEASCAKYPIPFWARRYMASVVISLLSRKIFPEVGFTNPTIM